MKILIIYYSLTGNVKYIAEKMAEVVHADLLPLELKNDFSRAGWLKFLKGGKQALMKEAPELLPLNKNPADYDLIIIGTPVWAWTFAPALRSFFNSVKFDHKKIALFCCHGGGKGAIFEKMKEALGDQEFLGEIDFVEPLKKETQSKTKSAIDWAKELVSRE